MDKSMNFLRAASFTAPTRSEYAWFFALVVTLTTAYFVAPAVFFLLTIIGFIFFLAKNLHLGIYLLAFFSFFKEWYVTINTARLADVMGTPLLTTSIRTPVGDMIALVVGVAFVIALLAGFTTFSWKPYQKISTGLILFGIFIALALFSASGSYNHNVLGGIKYVLRPMLFSCLAFVVLPLAVIRTKVVFERVIAIWLLVGALITIYGLASLFVGGADGLARIHPFPIAGLTPLGTNHNLIAEPLVALLPLGLFIWAYSREHTKKWSRTLGALVLGMFVVALLTLSRAAWLALSLEVMVLAYWHREQAWQFWNRFRQQPLFLLLLAGLIAYMGFFLTTSVVATSTTSRSDMLAIAWHYSHYAPWFGYGPGTFIQLIGETKYFIMEYGEPLESHGFMQKIFLEEGFVGLAVWLCFLIWLFWYVSRGARHVDPDPRLRLLTCLLAMTVGVVAFQVFNTSYFSSTMWLPIGVALVGNQLLRKGKTD